MGYDTFLINGVGLGFELLDSAAVDFASEGEFQRFGIMLDLLIFRVVLMW